MSHYHLSNDKNIVIIKSDKGNGIVLLDKPDYINKIEHLFSDTSKQKNNKIKCLFQKKFSVITM